MNMKDYIKRITTQPHKIELIYWWILRLLMIYGIFDSAINGDEYLGSSQPLQMAANLVGMFGFEFFQLMPAKSRLRLFSPRFQNITILGFFLGSFCGAYLNFYYAVPGFDKVLHALGTAEAVYIGYEYICATQIKFKKTCPHQIANLCALGFGFVLANAWELFEFLYDQFFGGDAQHWSYENALASANGIPENIFHLFPVTDLSRFALMDTMGDIVLNFVGAFLMYAFLCILPYRHKGKNNINKLIEENLKEHINN